MAKADIDFEKELWDVANELRGAVSEKNFKDYITLANFTSFTVCYSHKI
ncbi:hypothetical protein RM553_17545 [Zunongwangia sp. F363]|uniref:Site-specific DNA-methyltransferase (adenine-specific) n=1 Tax=Autumnicola tepida TaxID=3075595 RepID=A0ABU3CE68_9FLAO|nr:hypothetical protein [Zunongwangia sp. F363]MDT0644648.1 hypothetical protein [Zunongwangia sp. F363]